LQQYQDRAVVMVLGMHRSGTSLLSSILESLGVSLGETLIPADEYNARGYFEHAEIVRITISIAKKLHRQSLGPLGSLPYPANWWERSDLKEEINSLEQIVKKELDHNKGLWGFKDPHSVRMIPMWQSIFDRLGVDIKYIWALRHPTAVIRSLVNRDHIPEKRAELLWLEAQLEIIRYTKNCSPDIISYEKWFEAPVETFNRLASILGVKVAHSHITRLDELVDRDLLHFSEDESAPLLDLSKSLYYTLKRIESDEAEYEELKEFEERMGSAKDVLASWADDLETTLPQRNERIDEMGKRIERLNDKLNKKNAQIKKIEKDQEDKKLLLKKYEAEIERSKEDRKAKERQLCESHTVIKNLRHDVVNAEESLALTENRIRELDDELQRFDQVKAIWDARPKRADAWAMEFPELSMGPVSESSVGSGTTKINLCIVTPQFDGPTRPGEIGLWASNLAKSQVMAGHKVTVLYTLRDVIEVGNLSEWIDKLAENGIEFIPLPKPLVPNSRGWIRYFGPGKDPDKAPPRPASYEVYEWLKTKNFDVVHAPDFSGLAYYSLLSKYEGLYFPNTLFCIHALAPLIWRKLNNIKSIDDPAELMTAYMERKSVELADLIVSTSQYLLRWMASMGYHFPDGRTFHAMIPVPGPEKKENALIRNRSKPIREIVFLGSIEPRNGLYIFCDALERLAAGFQNRFEFKPMDLHVTFLGRYVPSFPGNDFLRQKLDKLKFKWNVTARLSSVDHLKYLEERDDIVVVFAGIRNCTADQIDCLNRGIPVIAAEATGAAESIREEDRQKVTFGAHPDDLVECLAGAIINGANIPKPRESSVMVCARWAELHKSIPWLIKQSRSSLPTVEIDPKSKDAPLVSVCIAHYNRPDTLEHTLEMLDIQEYLNIEVILVDDGSTNQDAIDYLELLEPKFDSRGWKIIRQKNRYLGAVRNTGARNASGKYLLFMDDDNCSKIDQITTFVKVAERTGADILTSFLDVFSGTSMPDFDAPARQRITPLGDDLAVGPFRNGFGDSNCLVRRESFLKLGGNSEDYRVGKDDWEFFARAVLNGYKLLVVPEALLWYRISEVRMRTRHYNLYAGDLRILRPFLSAVPTSLTETLLYAQGVKTAHENLIEQTANHGSKVWERDKQSVLKLTDSLSWRATAPLRAISRKIFGHPGEITPDEIERSDTPRKFVDEIYRSVSWEITAPLRWLGKLVEIFQFRRKS